MCGNTMMACMLNICAINDLEKDWLLLLLLYGMGGQEGYSVLHLFLQKLLINLQGVPEF